MLHLSVLLTFNIDLVGQIIKKSKGYTFLVLVYDVIL